MAVQPPLVQSISIDATWNGIAQDAVKTKISLTVTVFNASQLQLLQSGHSCVVSAYVAHAKRLSPSEMTSASFSPKNCFEAFSQPLNASVFEEGRDEMISADATPALNREANKRSAPRFALSPEDVRSPQEQNMLQKLAEGRSRSPKNDDVSLRSKQQDLPHDALSKRSIAFSPPPHPSFKNPTIPKRKNGEKAPTPEQVLGTTTQQPMHRRPLSLDKRPPWRPGGAEDLTPRGRRKIIMDMSNRKASKSAGVPYSKKAAVPKRRSSLPSCMTKTQKDWKNAGCFKEDRTGHTLPRGTRSNVANTTDAERRDATVTITRPAEGWTIGERIERWLEIGRAHTAREEVPEAASSGGLSTDYSELPSEKNQTVTLSASPTPSSQAALPWTSAASMRGGGLEPQSLSDCHDEEVSIRFTEDHGIMLASFDRYLYDNQSPTTFLITIHASIQLEPQPLGYHSFIVPGLPLQRGASDGVVHFLVINSEVSATDGFQSHQKVACVDENLALLPFEEDGLLQPFRLDESFRLNLLCYQPCRTLESSDFEVDYDVRARYDWENLDDDKVAAEHTMICSLRLRSFLMWAESAQFNLYLTGGPSGNLEVSLGAGHRRIYLEGRECDAKHELQLSMSCPVADLQATFIIYWEQSLGLTPFEIWLPRLSGTRRQTLHQIFDLPCQDEITLRPKSCHNARLYSRIAQDEVLEKAEKFYFFPENQLTPGGMGEQLAARDRRSSEGLSSSGRTSTSESRTRPASPLSLRTDKLLPRVSKRREPEARNKVRRHGDVSESKTNARPVSGNALRVRKNDTAAIKMAKTKLAGTRTTGASYPRFQSPVPWLSPNRVLAKLAALVFSCLRLTLRPSSVLFFILAVQLGLLDVPLEWPARWNRHVKMSVQGLWNRWDFQPVHLHGDLTGWRHLLGVLNRQDHQIRDLRSEEQRNADNAVQTIFYLPAQEDAWEQGMSDDIANVAGGTDFGQNNNDAAGINSLVAEGEEPAVNVDVRDNPKHDGGRDGSQISWLDRIDMALGWTPPEGYMRS